MYGLPQAGIIAQQLLESRLVAHGYRQSTVTPVFGNMIGDPLHSLYHDFGVKYVGIEHAKHLLQTLNTHYTTSHDWKGERYLGLTITWDYQRKQYVEDPDLSLLNKQDKTFVQEVIGVFLYYARAVDCTMLTALSSLATQQANPTQTTLHRSTISWTML
eukprot:CCRYP_021132-RA/>CCRYP_021132-RA protein AED:0.43 eAED:0.43 QI:0/0/0/1/0/0/3/0/158